MTYATASDLVNESTSDEFNMEKGLRQGRPLLPLLFNLLVETLLILINQFEDKPWLQGVHILIVLERTTIFQYVDETILFIRLSQDLDVRLRKCMLIFCIILGLHVNLHKSSLVKVGMEFEEVLFLASSMGFQIGSLPMNYLGHQLLG